MFKDHGCSFLSSLIYHAHLFSYRGLAFKEILFVCTKQRYKSSVPTYIPDVENICIALHTTFTGRMCASPGLELDSVVNYCRPEKLGRQHAPHSLQCCCFAILRRCGFIFHVPGRGC